MAPNKAPKVDPDFFPPGSLKLTCKTHLSSAQYALPSVYDSPFRAKIRLNAFTHVLYLT